LDKIRIELSTWVAYSLFGWQFGSG